VAKPKFETLVIGIRGKRRSGKDFTKNNIILPAYPQAKAYAYADRLRQICHEQYGLTYEQMLDPERKESVLAHYPVQPGDPLAKIICDFFGEKFPVLAGDKYWTPRLILIAEGQFKRAINPYYWADYVHDQINREEPPIAVITDARFPQGELQQLRDRGGKLVHITRSLANRGLDKELDDPSETLADSWTDWDAVWDNNGSLEQLRMQVVTTISGWALDHNAALAAETGV
jgi:hypothetical protein